MFQKLSKIKNYYLIFTSYFIGFGIIVALLVSMINYNFNYSNITDEVSTQIDTQITQKRAYLSSYLDIYERTLFSITQSNLTKQFIKTQNEEDKEKLSDLFYSLTYSNKDIMQLRYINEVGKEVIRVDRETDTKRVKKIPQAQMQDKSKRYYFKEIAKLQENVFWHSYIDLNIENEKIEVPFKPTFRIGTPFIIDGQFKGIIIVNIAFDDLLTFLTYSSMFDIYLIDKNGDIIKDSRDENSWSRYFDDKKKIHDIFPKWSDEILKEDFFHQENLHVYSLDKFFSNDEGFKIIFKTKETTIKNLQEQAVTSTFIIAMTIILVAAPLSWIISIVPSNLQSTLVATYEKLRKSSNIIDKYVIIYKMTPEGIITDISKKFTDITGYTHAQAVGKSIEILRHKENPKELYADMFSTLAKGQVWEDEMINLDKNGKDFWTYTIISPEFSPLGNIERYTAIAGDITNKKLIEKISITDELTQLYNRRKIEEVLKQEHAKTKRYENVFSIIFIDIDKFKSINDTYGHNAGDEVLVQLASILKENSRDTDFVGRWGGEEFIILCTQTKATGAYNLAETLRSIVENSKFSIKTKVTISSGVAQYESNENTLEIISRTDKALYKAKELGRNRVELA
jgi:diguanylate cyclase (GGDEF)-like protein/PAS domain S-box-containing protein